jgi:hypothetical protein
MNIFSMPTAFDWFPRVREVVSRSGEAATRIGFKTGPLTGPGVHYPNKLALRVRCCSDLRMNLQKRRNTPSDTLPDLIAEIFEP